jgi:hypothetical protein
VFERFECLCHRSTVNILKVNSAHLERNVRNAMANSKDVVVTGISSGIG